MPDKPKETSGKTVVAVGVLVLGAWAFMRFDCGAARSGSSPAPSAPVWVKAKPPASEPNNPESPPAPKAPTNEVLIRQADLGAEWPFTVTEGTLRCVGRGAWRPIVFSAGGVNYAINGTAKGRDTVAKYNLQEVRPIWRDNPEIPGTKIAMSPVIALGQKLCPPD